MKIRKKRKFFNSPEISLDYLDGYCDIFARVANRIFKYPMYGYFENRTIIKKNRIVEKRGLIHAFLCIEKNPSGNWIIFDVKGKREISDIKMEYHINETMWLDCLTQKDMKVFTRTASNVEQQKYEKYLMIKTKRFIRNNTEYSNEN